MDYIFARTERKLERYCKIKYNNLSFWVDEILGWWDFGLMRFWVGELLNLWIFEFVSFCVLSFELMSWRVDELMSWRVDELMYSGVVGFRKSIRQWVDLSSTSYMRGVFVLCWHHKDNKLHSIYRNIKSQDGLNILLCSSYNESIRINNWVHVFII